VRNAGLLLALCCCLSAASALWPGTMTAVSDERPAPSGAAVASTSPAPAVAPVDRGQVNIPPKALVGTLDTIGGTTFDFWANGPIYRMLVNAPNFGVHALWIYSVTTTGQVFPDRNMRYNYYDFATHAWNWHGPDYMADDGVNVFNKRAGYGNVDTDTTGIAIISAHSFCDTPDISPWVAKDAAPGAGIFDYSDTMDLGVCQWPPISVSQNGTINIFPMTAAYDLSYSHIAPGSWPVFATPTTGFIPTAGFPTHNIAASKASNKVSVVWEISTDIPEDAYQMHSTDGGVTWDAPATLDPPVAFGNGSDTLTSYYITSLFPWYDRQDKFHVVANLMPFVNDTGYIFPSQIWHYCPDNTPQWSRIHIATVDPANFQYALTINAALACRPSIGQDDDGDLFVTWEQFDTLNYEPSTSRARADIFGAGSKDNGLTWYNAVKLTDAGTHSMRFPSVIDLAVEGDPDTVFVLYEDDSVSGFYVAAGTTPSEGPASPNVAVVQKVPANVFFVSGVAEQAAAAPVQMAATAKPNPFRGQTRLSYVMQQAGRAVLEVFDLTGRSVAKPVDGLKLAGRYSTTLSAKGLVPGVYVARLSAGGRSTTRKLVLTE
jgi:hypothetical protein